MINILTKPNKWNPEPKNTDFYAEVKSGESITIVFNHEYKLKEFYNIPWSECRKNIFLNPKVNVFSVQVAGYDNTVLPENLYRGAILAGWTGREPLYAKAIIDTWNEIEG